MKSNRLCSPTAAMLAVILCPVIAQSQPVGISNYVPASFGVFALLLEESGSTRPYRIDPATGMATKLADLDRIGSSRAYSNLVIFEGCLPGSDVCDLY